MGDLPGLPMDQWRNITSTKEPPPELKTRRTSAGTLARYYPDYVRLMGLEEHFVENTVVTSVRQLHADVEEKVKMEPIPEQEAPVSDEIFSFESEEVASDDLSSQCSSMTGHHRRSLSSISVDSSLAPQSLPPPSLPSPCDRLRPPFQPYSCSLQCDYDDCDVLCNWNPIMNPSLFGSYKSSVPCGTSLDAYSASLQELGSKGHSWHRPTLAPLSPPHPLFEVAGYKITDQGQKPFKYLARNVVLATGRPTPQTDLKSPERSCHLSSTQSQSWRPWWPLARSAPPLTRSSWWEPASLQPTRSSALKDTSCP